MQKSFFESASAWIVRIGLWLIPFVPLYISSGMLFPYITGKNFAFRLIVEIVFAFWLGLAVLRREYRPRLTLLFKVVTVFVGMVFLADIFSPNPYRSLFSNYEHMEGFMMIGHLYLYFVMLISMFRTRRDWMVFLHCSLAASIAASFYGLLQRLGYKPSLQGGFRVDSTIGNPTYFAAYLLFHVWLLGILAYQYRRVAWRAALYGALLVAELIMIYFTATRGVVLALVVVAIPLAGAVVILWDWAHGVTARQWSIGRKCALAALALAVILPALFWSIRGSAWVQDSQTLRRLTNYSIHEGTVQDRLMIWGMSLHGVRERPVLGWGQENYYLVFQKYYNPGLYGAEPWFDRSHNVFLDWAVHSGIPGLMLYLAIFGVAVREIVRAVRRDRNMFFEGLLLIGLFASYFFQNLFVFDNLNSYLLFFAFLAYTEYRTVGVSEDGGQQSAKPERRGYGLERHSHAAITVCVMLALMGVWSYYTIVEPAREAAALITALGAAQAKRPLLEVRAAFEDALSHRTFGDTEVHEQLGNFAAQAISGGAGGTPDERKQFLDFVLDEMHRETARPAKDVKHVLFLVSILNRALTLDGRYTAEAQAASDEAIRLSPTKQPVYFERAQLYLSLGQPTEALHALTQAWRLEKKFRPAAINLWIVAAFTRDAGIIAELKSSYSLSDFDETSLATIARAYQQAKDFDGAREAFAALVAIQPASPQYHATYAALLAQVGRIAEARVQTQAAMNLDPNFREQGQQFLQQLGGQ